MDASLYYLMKQATILKMASYCFGGEREVGDK